MTTVPLLCLRPTNFSPLRVKSIQRPFTRSCLAPGNISPSSATIVSLAHPTLTPLLSRMLLQDVNTLLPGALHLLFPLHRQLHGTLPTDFRPSLKCQTIRGRVATLFHITAHHHHYTFYPFPLTYFCLYSFSQSFIHIIPTWYFHLFLSSLYISFIREKIIVTYSSNGEKMPGGNRSPIYI